MPNICHRQHNKRKQPITVLVEKNIIPIILGGSQDLTYSNYRAYDSIMPMVNIVNVDTNFDLGDANLPIKNKTGVSALEGLKIINV